MSDPVTNVEIEDVLTSIRRLVAQGDKPRLAVEALKNKATTPVQPSRFVLTPSLRVAEKTETVSAESEVAELARPAAEPLILTQSDAMQKPLMHDGMSATELASLEATIAELEAAVTSQPDEWEPDGSEAILTTGLAEEFAATLGDVDDAEVAAADSVVALHPQQGEPTFRHASADDADTDYGDELRDNTDEGMPIPDDLDETLAAYIAGGSKMEHEEIRRMVVEVVRQELQGDLGERITRNVRKLVRKEIHRAMSENFTD